MSNVRVKNMKGTSNQSPPSGYVSWLDYWERNKYQKALACSNVACKKRATTDLCGGHVQHFYGRGDSKGYIVPLCPSCNAKGRQDTEYYFDFYVSEDVLVPVP